jgi:hypothetical protein
MALFEPEPNEGFAIELYEARPDAFNSPMLPKIVNTIFHHYKVQKLPLTKPPLRFYRYGSDLPIDYKVDEIYSPYEAPTGDVKLGMDNDNPQVAFFLGDVRKLLMPNTNKL